MNAVYAYFTDTISSLIIAFPHVYFSPSFPFSPTHRYHSPDTLSSPDYHDVDWLVNSNIFFFFSFSLVLFLFLPFHTAFPRRRRRPAIFIVAFIVVKVLIKSGCRSHIRGDCLERSKINFSLSKGRYDQGKWHSFRESMYLKFAFVDSETKAIE